MVQEERIELLDKLEQFPLKIRVKEEQDTILRSTLLPLGHSTKPKPYSFAPGPFCKTENLLFCPWAILQNRNPTLLPLGHSAKPEPYMSVPG